jgi:ABC-type Fe3+ transport system permease subunit
MKPRRTRHIVGIVLGSVLLLSPLVALFGTVFGMQRAFDLLGSPGLQDPKALSSSIASVLYVSVAGVIGFVCGVVLLTISIVLFIRAGRTPHAAASPASKETGSA